MAGLLSETEPARLSDTQVQEALRITRSFEKRDLVVIDWDAALAVEIGGKCDDIIYVLELANLQLEEFRAIDMKLDRYVDRAYRDMERRSYVMFVIATRVLRVLRSFRLDVTKLADEVSHITKFFGDWYLSRVYLGAHERFHLDKWRDSVQRRLAQLDQLYRVAHDEVYEQRMLWLELVIVILFVIDVAALFLMKH